MPLQELPHKQLSWEHPEILEMPLRCKNCLGRKVGGCRQQILQRFGYIYLKVQYIHSRLYVKHKPKIYKLFLTIGF